MSGEVREKHDYPAMLAELQTHPNEWRVVWRRSPGAAERGRAAAIARTLDEWIKRPHRGATGQALCRRMGCDHRGDGAAHSRIDKVADEAQVYARWVGEYESAVPTDLATWLLLQIHVDRTVAEHALLEWVDGDDGDEMAGQPDSILVGAHLVRWNPRRVLAECDTKRRIIELHAHDDKYRDCPTCTDRDYRMLRYEPQDPHEWCETLRLLALSYVDRPGYREEWKP